MIWCLYALELCVKTVDVLKDFLNLCVGGLCACEDFCGRVEVEGEVGVCFEGVFCCGHGCVIVDMISRK